MSKKAKLPQSPHHILVFDEDWAYLESRFGPTGVQPVGISTIIRAIIHQRVVGWREAETALADQHRAKAA